MVHNTIVEAIMRELIVDGIVVKQQKESTQTTQKIAMR
jgi:hypothetical protein